MAEHKRVRSGRLHRWWQRVRSWSVLGGLIVATGATAADAVPAHWIAYATQAGNVLSQRLSRTEDPRVVRLQGRLAERNDASDALTVSLWIDPNGTITASRFASLGDAAADADLRALLGAAPLPTAPPPDMRQPLNLGLSLSASASVDAPAP